MTWLGLVILGLGNPAWSQWVINEIDADQTGADTAEFIELFDGGAGGTSLDGIVLVLVNGGRDSVYRVIDLEGQVASEEGYFVVGSPDVPNVNWILDPGRSGAIQNGPDGVALYRRAAETILPGSPVDREGLIDALVYGTDDAEDRELLEVLTPGGIQANDDPVHSLSRVPDGGKPLSPDRFQRMIPTPGLPNVLDESLSLSISHSEVRESGPEPELSVTIARDGSTSGELMVSLVIDDPSELAGPEMIALAAGQKERIVPLIPVDDRWPDGDQRVQILAQAVGFREAQAEILVLDDGEDLVAMVVNEAYVDDREDANGDAEGEADGPGFDEFV